MELNIVLAEPQIPQNTGNIARTCAVTGARLHLIKPLGFEIDDKKLKHAGLDYWHYLDISYYEGFGDFFGKTQGEYFYYSTKAVNTYSDVVYPDKCYIVFGREDKGVTCSWISGKAAAVKVRVKLSSVRQSETTVSFSSPGSTVTASSFTIPFTRIWQV